MHQSNFEEWLPLRGRWLGYFLLPFKCVLAWIFLCCSLSLLRPPGSLHQAEKGQAGAAVTQIQNFKTAIELYTADRGQPPLDLEWLISSPSVIPPEAPWKGPYLNDVTSVPLDPWQHPYIYDVPGPGREPYWIVSYGADGRPGGEGDAADLTPDARVKTEFRWTGFWPTCKQVVVKAR